MKKLPKTLSKLMRIALADLYKAERSKYVNVDMIEWVYIFPTPDHSLSVLENMKNADRCSVCFAGAVMAFSTNEFDAPGSPNHDQYCALDYVRRGHVRVALIRLDQNYEKWSSNYDAAIPVTEYETDRKQWRKDMWKIVRKLERIGL